MLEPISYRLSDPAYRDVRISRTFFPKEIAPWYIIDYYGEGDGSAPDYWREDEGWVFERPSRYATAEEAAQAFLAAPPERRQR